MAFWNVREELSLSGRLRRSYYEMLRDDLDQLTLKYSLMDSYENFKKNNLPYPFVEKRELKPRARIPTQEYSFHNAFLIIFFEDTIPDSHKKHLRFFDVNKTSKRNLIRSETLSLTGKFDRKQKCLESAHFYDFLKLLLPIDYALLIQRDSTIKKNRYNLTHFHVRIDWPIADAAEDLARSLRYISKDLYEKGDKYAEDVQKKYFEYYGLPVMSGGRRTAAIVAAQYLRRVPHITTIYAGSSETRALIRISERGVSKAILIPFSEKEISHIADTTNVSVETFKKRYSFAQEEDKSICIFQATYAYTNIARPPDDGKLRELKPDLYWLTVGGQHILPLPGEWDCAPLPYNTIYS